MALQRNAICFQNIYVNIDVLDSYHVFAFRRVLQVDLLESFSTFDFDAWCCFSLLRKLSISYE